ncbi:hypothetical protein SGM_2398 [Streptomyces griseoaurantiacus M045]|uniref:Uncharacterized protein n=1 Tax=Streptomyces griseoaurantiacus M045 TaxID=996637 RepID=F3NGY4_9ACTN|nr:hypothetical protein SGM_2398 [Streptomyces griseoaurantiacus M045]
MTLGLQHARKHRPPCADPTSTFLPGKREARTARSRAAKCAPP